MHRIKQSPTVRDHGVLFVCMMTGNALNFLYHFIMGRMLGPEGFGVFTTLFSIYYLLYAMVVTLQGSMAKTVAELTAHNNSVAIPSAVAASIRKVSKLTIVVLIPLLAATPWILPFLQVPLIPWLIVVASILPLMLLPLVRGRLQGEQKFLGLGISFIVEGITKTIIGIGLVLWGFHVTGAIIGVALSLLTPFIVLGLPFAVSTAHAARLQLRTAIPFLAANIVTTAAYAVDTMILNARFSPSISGLYAGIALFGKILLFASVSFPQVVIAQASHLHAQQLSTRDTIRKPLILTILIASSATIIYSLIGELVLTTILGTAYSSQGIYMIPIAIYFGSLGITTLILQYSCAIEEYYRITIIYLAFATEITVLVLAPSNLASITWGLAITHLCSAIALCATLFIPEKSMLQQSKQTTKS